MCYTTGLWQHLPRPGIPIIIMPTRGASCPNRIPNASFWNKGRPPETVGFLFMGEGKSI
jgi:hypothetical protein